MAYNAKTNWQLNDTVQPTDINRIEQGIKDLDDNKLDKTENASSATKLLNSRTFTVSGAATGTAQSFNGEGNVNIPITSLDATKLSGTASVDTTGNSGSTTKLQTKRKINVSGVVTGTAQDFDGSADVNIPVTSVDATKLSGTASIDTTGKSGSTDKLATKRTIALSGGVTGTATEFDGSTNITIPVTSVNVDNLNKVIPITKGGTGATTVNGAITNLGLMLVGNVTLHVTTAGNDTTGNGTNGTPYRTINKALSTLPKNLNGKTVIINVGAGTYSENVTVKDFFGGTITINGNVGASVTVTGITIENANVLTDGINITVGSGGIFIGTNGLLFSAVSNITVSGATNGVTLRYGGRLEVSTTLTINNATGNALWVQYNSSASVNILAGSGNNVGINILSSTVYCQRNNIVATVASGIVAGQLIV